MGDIIVSAKTLRGRVEPPPYKSEVIRLLLLAGLCGVRPESFIRLPNNCGEDIANAVRAVNDAFFRTEAERGETSPLSVHVGESATLLRLMLPALLRRNAHVRFFAAPSLLARSFDEFESCLGCRIVRGSGFIDFFRGAEPQAFYSCNADKSSQFAGGMLLRLAAETLLGSEKKLFELEIPNPVSRPYLMLTLETVKRFGCTIVWDERGIYRLAHGVLHPPTPFSPAAEPAYDYSYAANFVAANAFGAEVLLPAPKERERAQADFAIHDLIFRDSVDISDSPDLFPILCIAACGKKGTSTVFGTARLRGKESDRVSSTAECIRALGGNIECSENCVVIRGTGTLIGGTVNAFRDHRIVMATAIASLICTEPVVICGYEAVNKSAPQFFDDFKALGGTAIEHIR